MSNPEVLRLRKRRQIDDHDNQILAISKVASSRQESSATEEDATRRRSTSLRWSSTSNLVATHIPLHDPLTESLSPSVTGESAACPICHVSASGIDQPEFQKGAWAHIDVWAESASRGCKYCRIIALGAVRSFRSFRKAAETMKLRIRALGGPFSSTLVDVRSRNDNIQVLTVLEFYMTQGNSNSYSVFGPFMRAWSKPSRESQINEAASLLRDCMTSHEACRQEPSEMPSRLIEISIVNAESWLRLVETKLMEKSFKERYVALSHCWGSVQPLRLMKSNLSSMKARIPWHAFPRLFKDAIALTWSLDVRYLWIDALCIIQDDSLDWQLESARMGDIYKSSFVTVVASLASSSDGTIFAGNGESVLGEGISETQESPLRHGSSVNVLHTRAWAFQEVILGRRILDFGPSGILFHCCSMQVPEYSKNQHELSEIQKVIWFGVYDCLWKIRSFFANSVKASCRDDNLWFVIVESYSRRNLTQPSDKLPALSGLAALYLKHKRTNEQYFAGLWEGSFIYGLHWGPDPEITKKIIRHHAPSWSWSSLMGRVNYAILFSLFGSELHKLDKNQIVARVIKVECETIGSNPFGEVAGGTAVLRGLLLDARMSLQPDTDRPNIFPLKLRNTAVMSKCCGYGTALRSCTMPDWVGDTAFPYLSDCQWVHFDSKVKLVTIPNSPPRCCGYLRRHQQERHIDGPSDSWTPEETANACVHVYVLILTHTTQLSESVPKEVRERRRIMGLVLGRPDPSKEVYERLALFQSIRDTSNVKVKPKYFSGGVKDVVII